MSLRWIGPIQVSEHGNPTFSFTGEVLGGMHAATVGGTLAWSQAQQLAEMTVVQRRMVTAGAHTGVLEVLWFDDTLLAPFSGRYILKPAVLGQADSQWSVNGVGGPVPISMAAVFVGANRIPEIGLSSRQLANDFGLVGEPIFAPVFWDEDATGSGPPLVSIGGRPIPREYDETSPMVWP
jgi:hypothetical protein